MSAGDPSLDLQIILERLSYARSNWERAQLLFQSWRKIRALSPEERDRLAMLTGIEGADELINHLIQHKTGKKAPPELSAAIRSLEKEDPKKVARLLESLKNPGTFQNQQVISDTLSRVGERMLDEASAASAPPPDFSPQGFSPNPSFAQAPPDFHPSPGYPPEPSFYPPAAASRPAAPVSPPLPAVVIHPAATAPPAAATASAPAAATATSAATATATSAATAAATATSAASATATAAGAARSATAAAAVSRPEAAAVSRPEAAAAAVSKPDAWSTLQRRVSDGPEEVAAVRGPSALAQRLRREPRLIHKFRVFHSIVDQLVSEGDDACDEAIAAFPQGWARGRALGQLLQAGAYPEAARAEAAVARVDSPATRRSLLWLLASRLERLRDAAREARPLPPPSRET